MGKKSTPAPPPAPDYAAAATAQGSANLDAARTGAELTNTNQVTPYGNQTFTKSPDSDQWTSTINLSPEQQRLYDLQTQGQTALGETAVAGLDRVRDSMNQPLDLSGAPARVNSVAGPQYEMYSGTGPSMAKVGAAPDYQNLGTGPTNARYTDQIAQLPDYAKQAQQVEDSIYNSATTRLDPQFAQQENSERQRLLNAGVAEGSEAYNNAMNDFSRNKQAAYGDARDRAIQGRGAEQSRLNNDFYTGNAQQFGQKMQSLGFNNAAGQSEFDNATTTAGFNNATAAQKYADTLRGTQFNNAADQQEFNNQLQALGFNNQAEAQQYLDSIASGNFQNTQRGAAIDEAAYLRSDPLNMYNALSSGAQVTNPTFRGTGQVQGPAPAPVFAGAQAQDQRAIDLYNAQLAQSGSAQGGLFGMLGSLGGAALGGGGILSSLGGGK